MDSLINDLRYASRMLLKSPAFTGVAVLSLALGIGANATIFTLINATLLAPLPVEEPSRLVAVYTTDERNRGGFNDYMPTSHPNFEDYRDQSGVFEGMTAWSFIPLNWSGAGDPEQIQAEIVSGNFFRLLGVRPAAGRFFLPEEDAAPGTHLVAVLSHGFWKRRFAADPSAVGATLTLNGHGFTVVGVAPQGFQGINALGGPDLWVPMMTHPQTLTGFFLDNFRDRRALLFSMMGRLKPGVTLERAEAALRSLASNLEREYPEPNRGRSVSLLPIGQATINPFIRRVFVLGSGLLMTVVGLVLLIACANVANLMLARSTARRKEIAVRMALGAGRARLVRQLLAESVLLAVLGGAAGLLLAVWGRDLLLAYRPPQVFPIALDLPIDASVLGFTLGVSLLTGILFGLAPALQCSRPDLVTDLKEKSAQSGGGRFNLRNVLVAGQVALSLVSLIGAGLFLRGLASAQRVDPGVDTRNLLVLGFDLGAQGYDRVRGEEFHRRLLEQLAAAPGVRAAALSTMLPIGGGGFGRTVYPEGREPSAGDSGVFVTINTVSPGYFDALGVALLRGRTFTDLDRDGAPRAAVINEAMARRFWPGEEAVGKRFKFYGDQTFAEVAGVVETTKLFSLGEDPQPVAYLPLLQAYEPALTLNLRTASDPAGLAESVRRHVQGLDPTLPVVNVFTGEDLLDQTLWAPRVCAGLLSLFGLVALALAAVGIYGVMSYSVNRRTHELGIRMALGARAPDVLRLVLRQGMTLVAVGLLAGLVASLVAARAISSLLFGVSAADPATYATLSAVLAGVALLAAYLPARRATKVDPMIALRAE